MTDNDRKALTLSQLPANVHVKHGAYYLVRRQDGKRKWLFLCRCADGEHVLYAELAKVTNPKFGDMRQMIESFVLFGMSDLRPATQKNYRHHAKLLTEVFGDMDPGSVEPGHIAEFLYAREQAGSPVSGNRAAECLSSVFNYGMRVGACKINPCYGVRRNRQRPARRYIEHRELEETINRASEPVQDFLALAYLTGLRQKDLREMRKGQITPDGVVVDESKTGKRRVVEWSESLRFFLTRACSRAPESEYVLTNTRGQPWSEWAVQSFMRRLGVDWNIHKLRHKAETDHKEGMGMLSLYSRVTRHKPVK